MEKQNKIFFSIIDYSQSPGPRYCIQGADSGEDFYHKKLNRIFAGAYQDGAKLCILLDGADGYASSFLDEAFGNLVYDFSAAVVSDLLEIISNDEEVWIKMIKEETIPEWEKRRKNGDQAKVTENHEKWFRLDNGELKEDVWIRTV